MYEVKSDVIKTRLTCKCNIYIYIGTRRFRLQILYVLYNDVPPLFHLN